MQQFRRFLHRLWRCRNDRGCRYWAYTADKIWWNFQYPITAGNSNSKLISFQSWGAYMFLLSFFCLKIRWKIRFQSAKISEVICEHLRENISENPQPVTRNPRTRNPRTRNPQLRTRNFATFNVLQKLDIEIIILKNKEIVMCTLQFMNKIIVYLLV